MEFGQYMRSLRERENISLRSLSFAIGVDPAHLSRIEAGKVRPSESLILRLTQILKCDPEELQLLSGRQTTSMREFIKKDPEFATSVLRRVSTMSVAESVPAYRVPDLVDFSLKLGEDALSERPISPLKKSLCRRGRAIVAEDKARDRRESLDSGRERNAVLRSQGPDTARMDFFNGLLLLTASKTANSSRPSWLAALWPGNSGRCETVKGCSIHPLVPAFWHVRSLNAR